MWRPKNWSNPFETKYEYKEYKKVWVIYEKGADDMLNALAAHVCFLMFSDAEKKEDDAKD